MPAPLGLQDPDAELRLFTPRVGPSFLAIGDGTMDYPENGRAPLIELACASAALALDCVGTIISGLIHDAPHFRLLLRVDGAASSESKASILYRLPITLAVLKISDRTANSFEAISCFFRRYTLSLNIGRA